MRTKPIIAGAVFAVLLLGSVLFIGTRPSPIPITVRHIKSVRSKDLTDVTFQITNLSARRYWVCPSVVEVHSGPVWRRCFDLNSYLPQAVEPSGFVSPTFRIANLPTNSALRLSMLAGNELHGLEALLQRFKLRVLKGDRRYRLNKSVVIFTDPIPILSDEFVEPEPNQ